MPKFYLQVRTLAQKPKLEVFKKYAEKLIRYLPMNDFHFIAMLFKHELLPEDTTSQLKVLPTPAEKASFFLSNVIIPALYIDDTSSFDNLLSVMEHCGYVHVEKLAHEIKSETINTGPGMVCIHMYSMA